MIPRWLCLDGRLDRLIPFCFASVGMLWRVTSDKRHYRGLMVTCQRASQTSDPDCFLLFP